MCKDCSDQIKLEFPDGRGKGFKATKEQLAALPGKQSKTGKKSESNTLDWEEHRLFRRGYEALFREWDKTENNNQSSKYQKRYNEIYSQNHATELAAYNKKYARDNPDYGVRATSRRVERLKLVEREKYTMQDILDKWGTLCHLCGVEIDFFAPRHTGSEGWEYGYQKDHVIPISLGGSDTLANVKPAHGVCNQKKQTKVVTELSPEDTAKMEELEKKFPSSPRGRPLKD
jgi:5-methylcytosine-specific restriction endonuclease McrA